MKIKISKDSVVYQGPAYEDSHWGEVQFPEIVRCADGALAIKTHVADDSWKVPFSYRIRLRRAFRTPACEFHSAGLDTGEELHVRLIVAYKSF